MSEYLNPGNETFGEAVASDYVDKTNVLALLNRNINRLGRYVCMSRPRRFGKSLIANMACAYYCKVGDSRSIFQNFAISADPSYEEHINKYDVFYIDMAGQCLFTDNYRTLIPYLTRAMTEEIHEQYPEVECSERLITTLRRMVEHTGNKIVMIIDEWDAPIRENSDVTADYLIFLRDLFKNGNISDRVFALVYMTGILPIRKKKSEAALSNFKVYSALYPGQFCESFGFTESEIKALCASRPDADFEKLKFWYDGYHFGAAHSMYNPYAVMNALEDNDYRSYWTETSASETLKTYIKGDYDKLQERIMLLIAGTKVKIDPSFFDNDVNSMKNGDDVLTLLVHLGYLTREVGPDPDEPEGTNQMCDLVSIPNEELRREFKGLLRNPVSKRMVELLKMSEELMDNTEKGNEEGAAKAIQKIHDSYYSPTHYNDEQALRCVIRVAYLPYEDRYARIEELPSGHGIADIAYIPKKGSICPALLVELKWNATADEALAQIKARQYTSVLLNLGHDIILVGIGYSNKTKEHACRIEMVRQPGTP